MKLSASVALLTCLVTAPWMPAQAGRDAAGAPEEVENRLAASASPYLRQHADNPVHWQPWDDRALALARRLDRPIFLSIGYSACHWCHVMAKESFSDPKIAALLNESFVCIKVDREERPDIDQIYMGALQAMGRPGGWPLSAWLTPDGEPFFGGTYFPPEDSRGLPAFRRVCEALVKAWREDRERVVSGAKELGDHLARALAPPLVAGEPTAQLFDGLTASAASWFDEQEKGFAAPPQFAPKFPQAPHLAMLLEHDAGARRMALETLDAMRRGGIHDQLGGGFHRYSTDRAWEVPHFEKMLYDNAQLASVYLRASAWSGDARLADVGRRTLDYLVRELQAPSGGFWASQDAQSEGVEGKFFVWTQDEVRAAAGDAADEVCEVFGVTAAGNWEGVNVLTLRAERPRTARFEAASAALRSARDARVRPATDDKLLVAWNGFAIEALCDGYRAMGEARWLASAQRAADFLLTRCVDGGRVRRSWQGAAAPFPGYLEDHAALACALLALFECDAEPRWLAAARDVLDAAVAHFGAVDGSFYFTADDHETLLARAKNANEGATPSGVALMARALMRAGLLLGSEERYERGLAVLRAHHDVLRDRPDAVPSLARAAMFHLGDPREVVVVGEPGDPRTAALLRAAWGGVGLPRVCALLTAGNRARLEELSPLFVGKTADGAPRAYVCSRGACRAPVTTAAELSKALAAPSAEAR